MEPLTQLSKPSDLKDWAYENIKQVILNSQILPGEQLHIEKLAEKMSISRTPIREALLKLQSDGLVRAASRVGFFVSGITKRDLRELFELREITEGYAAEKAAPLLTDDDLAQIDNLHKKGVSAVEKGDLSEFNEMEIALHSFIIQHSQNRRLLKLIESLKDLTYRERLLALKSIENVRESLAEHKKIVDALHKRDAKLAGQLMKAHISNVKQRLLAFKDIPEESD